MYVADETNSGTCLSDVECFIQTLAVYPESATFFTLPLDIYFSGNTAIKQGPNLFGGVLDRYITSSFAEVYRDSRPGTQARYDGVTYLKTISNITVDSISSLPV